MKNRLVTSLAIAMISLLSISLVVAQEIEISSPSFFDKVLRIFSENSFTIVGQDNHASVYADQNWTINPGATFTKTKLETNGLCNGKSGFYNVFARLPNDNTWYERFETIDVIGVKCKSTNRDCIIELYCMPYYYPPTDTSCNAWSPGSVVKTKTVTDTLMPLTDGITGNDLTSYSYCTEGCTDAPIQCWRVNGQECQSRDYSCGYATYPSCPSPWLYSSSSICQQAIPPTPTPTPEPTPSPSPTPTPTPTTILCGDGKCAGGENYEKCPSDCHVVVKSISLATPNSFSKELPIVSNKGRFIIEVENKKDFEVSTNIEAGYYTEDYASEIALLPKDTLLGSIFSIVNAEPKENCEKNEGFVKSARVTLNPHEKKFVYIDFESDMVISSYITKTPKTYLQKDIPLVAFAGIYDSCCEVQVSGGCKAGTGGYQYYKTEWNYKPSISCLKDQSILCDGQQYGTFDCKLDDDKIVVEKDYRVCLNKVFTIQNISVEEQEEIIKASGKSLIDVKKLALTKDQISKSTTPQLLASSCKFDSECLERIEGDEKYSISCNSISSLRAEGIITESKVKEVMDTGKNLVTAGVIGGSLGGAAGLGLCALGVGAATVATFTTGVGGALLIPATATCASLVSSGALVGAGIGVGGTLAWDTISDDDELVKAFKSGDANAVGICTAEKPFDLAGFIESIGNKIKITGDPNTDGLIILGVGIFLLLFLMGSLGGRR